MLKIVAQLIFVEAVKNYVMNRKNSMYLKKTLLSHYCRYNVSMLNKSISLLKKKNILTPNCEKIVCDYDAILYKVTDQVRFYLLSKTSFYSHLMLGRCSFLTLSRTEERRIAEQSHSQIIDPFIDYSAYTPVCWGSNFKQPFVEADDNPAMYTTKDNWKHIFKHPWMHHWPERFK